ncbi:MAG: FAD:protein FMN transferase [Oscillospiraceae bacterium]|nr:FAD:protein FMN transferase [Oscillospiraceae bacterium]
MDTYMTVQAYGADDALLREAADCVNDLDARLSVTREDSEIARLNREGHVSLSPDTAALLSDALAVCERTHGALDVTVYPVVRAWGFTTGEYRVPSDAELDKLLPLVDYRAVSLDGGEVTLPQGAMIDLGSVAKGYAGDRIAALLREGGVRSALLSLGGNIQTVGHKPDGSDWRIAVRAPQGDGYLGVAEVADKAVVTSGGYERYFVDENGETRWHIMDPATGMPAKSGLVSVTVVGDEGLTCDALSTALFTMGLDKAADFWRQSRDFEMLLLTEDGALYATPGLAACFTPERGCELQVIGDD